MICNIRMTNFVKNLCDPPKCKLLKDRILIFTLFLVYSG